MHTLSSKVISGWVCTWTGWLSFQRKKKQCFFFIIQQLLHDIGNTHTHANRHGGEWNNNVVTPLRGEPIMLFNTHLTAWNPKAAPSSCQLSAFTAAAFIKPRENKRWDHPSLFRTTAATGQPLLKSSLEQVLQLRSRGWRGVAGFQLSVHVFNGARKNLVWFLSMSNFAETKDLTCRWGPKQNQSLNGLTD